jgi:AraC family transcriptional activator of pobA
MKSIPIRQISDRVKNTASRFSIRYLEVVLNGKPLQDELHRHDYFFILLIKSGSGEHMIDFINHRIKDHSLFILRPGQIHQLSLEKDCTGFLMQFDSGFYVPESTSARQRFRRAANKNYCSPETSRFEKLYAVLEQIYQENTSKEEGFLDVIRANLDIFCIQAVRQSRNSGQKATRELSYEQERFEELFELLERHASDHKSVVEYAEMLKLSVYQLNKITKSTVGKTVSELIHEQLVLESKRTLLGTSNQVKDIAYSLGFDDVSYFIRFFKKSTGFSPEAFRNNFS